MLKLLETEVNATADVFRYMLATFAIPELLPSVILVSQSETGIARRVLHYERRNLTEVMIDAGEKSRGIPHNDFLFALLIAVLMGSDEDQVHEYLHITATSAHGDYVAVIRLTARSGYLRPCADVKQGPVPADGQGLAEYFWIGRTGKHFPTRKEPTP
jgi:hypothetical protein